LEIKPKQPSVKAPAETFTGDAWFDVIARGEEPSRIRVNVVRFAPGARNAWHWHGAAPSHFMTHLAMWEGPGEGQGPETQWGDLVTDAEYQAGPGA
jgi:quercetin dioxygenase-like cupin family protein